MESLGRFPRVLNVLPREKIEGPPRDFLKANPRPHPNQNLAVNFRLSKTYSFNPSLKSTLGLYAFESL